MAAETLLNYALTTDPFPLQASPDKGNPLNANLTIVASNPDPETPVTVTKISITIPIGADGSELSIVKPPDPVAPADWRLSDTKPGDHLVQYVFRPNAGAGHITGKGLAFIFNAIEINKQPGTVKVTIDEGSDGDPFTDLFVTKFPAEWGKVEFWADPPIVPAGGATTLNWRGPSAATYTIEYISQRGIVHVPKQGDPPLSNNGRYPGQEQAPLKLDRNTTFYLKVSAEINGNKYEAQRFVTVSVESVKIKAFGPDHAVDALEKVTIDWTTSSAKTVSIEPGDQPPVDASSGSGHFIVQPTQDTTYNLTAKDAHDNKKVVSVTVHVHPAKITLYKATPAAVRLGKPVTLSWKTSSSALTSIQPGIGNVDQEGSQQLTPSLGVTAYTLTAQSQFPPAVETISVIAAQPGFNQAVANRSYAGVEGALVIGNTFYMLDTWDAEAWSSPDGLVWRQTVLKQPWTQRMDACFAVFDNGSGPRMWILGGTKRDSRDRTNEVWRANDEAGTSWALVQPANNKIWSPRSQFGCAVYNKKIWVFGGRGPGGAYLNDVWSSTDGTNWTLETDNPGWTGRFAFTAATFIHSSPATNQIWIFGGYTKENISDPTNEVYYTNDGVHWSRWSTSPVPWKPRSNPLVQQIGTFLWLTGGTDGGVGNNGPTPFRDMWFIGASEHHFWSEFGQEAPWTGIGSGVPGTSAVFHDLMWCVGTQKQFGDSLGVWYFLPDR